MNLTLNLTDISRFISLILRHKPESIGITLDEHGWANVDELIEGISRTQYFDREMLEYLGRYFPQPLYHAAVGTIHEDALSDEENAARMAGMKVMIKDAEEN